MYYSRYMSRGGCPTCGMGNNTNFRNRQSPNYFNNRRYIHTVKNDFESQDINNEFNPYNYRKRIMTPPRNNSNFYFNNDNNYYNINKNSFQNSRSPMRNTGCINCSMSSSKIINGNNYQRPSTGYYMNRTNNPYTFNKINYENYRNYNQRKRYNNMDNKDEIDDNVISRVPFNQNRYYSPIRNLKNSFSSENIFTNPNENRNDYSYNQLNTLNNYYHNKRFNNFRYNNNYNHNINNIRTILNNKYRNLLDDNNGNINNNRNNYFINDNSNNIRNNFYRNDNINYYSPDFRNNRINYNNAFNNAKSIDFSNSRFNYLITKDNTGIGNNTDRFFTLNVINFSRKIREMIEERKTFFIYLFGSRDYTGQSWCSDCNIARPNVERAKDIIKNKRYEGEVYFISIPIEKINKEDFRDDPIIQLERVPTLIFFENGIERNRLIENDLFSFQIINEFIMQAYNQYNNINQYLYQQRNYY